MVADWLEKMSFSIPEDQRTRIKFQMIGLVNLEVTLLRCSGTDSTHSSRAVLS